MFPPTHLGYILGEYGHLVANEPGYSPSEQFMILHSKSQFCSAPTRALLLSTYIKWVNVFPEIKQHLVAVFERYRHVLDSDLQQRACEYYALSLRPEEDELLQNVCEEMPPFPARESALLGRLNKKLGDTEDKRTWIHGGKEANIDRELLRKNTTRRGTIGTSEANGNGNGNAVAGQVDDNDIMNSLRGLDLSAGSELKMEHTEVKPPIPPITHGANVDRWYEKLCYAREGVLYEDVQIQMGIKSEYHGHEGRLAVFIGNKMSAPLTSFTATLHVQDTDALSVSFLKMPPSTIASRTQVQQLLTVECKKMFNQSPLLSVSFLAGAHQSVTVRLPVVTTKFFEPVKLGPSDFFERWKIIGGPPREAQLVFPISLDSSGQVDTARNKAVVAGHSFDILEEVDPNPLNLVGAGVLHTTGAGKVGCLLRLEPNKDAKVGTSLSGILVA